MRLVQWDVWLANGSPQVGSEQGGIRPVIIVGSPDICRTVQRLALVVPCTTTFRDLAWHAPVTLVRPSFAMCEQVRSISRDRLIKPMTDVGAAGSVDEVEREEIRWVLAHVLGLRT